MKIEIEPKDMESIALKLMDLLKPLMISLQREKNELTEGAGQNQRVLMDVQGVAKYLGVKVSWIYDKTRKKEIPYAKVGKYLRFRKSTIDDWLVQERTARG
jgi:excisionase family DNA binding protein